MQPIQRRVARSPTVGSGVDEVVAPAAGLDFEHFFVREYRSVVGLAALLCGNRAIAEDLAQDAFVAAHRRWEKISRYDDPAAWIRRVVANLAVSSVRRRLRELRALGRLSRARALPSADIDADDEAYWAAVRALPGRQAQCVALRYLDDRSIQEIAVILGLAASTVRVHLHRASSTLAIRLGEIEGVIDDT